MIVPAPNVARCSEAPADVPLVQEFPSATSTERSKQSSANRKWSRSTYHGFQSTRSVFRGSVGVTDSSTRRRYACGLAGGYAAPSAARPGIPVLGFRTRCLRSVGAPTNGCGRLAKPCIFRRARVRAPHSRATFT